MSATVFLRRALQLIPVLFGVSIVSFIMIHLSPTDPVLLMLPSDAPPEVVESMRARLGLDQPLPVQYIQWLSHVLRGDLGESIRMYQPVSTAILEHFQNTLVLAATALAFAFLAGVILGFVAAVKRDSAIDRLSMIVAVLGWSLPPFWLGLVFIIVFAVQLDWLPTGGMYNASAIEPDYRELPRYLVLPALTLGLRHMSYIARMMRSSMLEVLGQDYVRTARAKGLSQRTVLLRHAFRNALIPVVTVAGVSVGRLLGGAVIVETVFSWPGLGDLVVNAIIGSDFPLVQGAALFIASLFVFVNLLVDVLYGLIDPRIRYI